VRIACLVFSRLLNPQHATFMNVTFGSSSRGDTHVGAMLHPGSPSGRQIATRSTSARGGGDRAAVAAGYEIGIRIGLARAARPFPARLSKHRHMRCICNRRCCGPAPVREGPAEDLDALGLAGSYPSGVAQFYYSGRIRQRIQAAHAAQSGVAASPLTNTIWRTLRHHRSAAGFARAYAGEWIRRHRSGLGERYHLLDTGESTRQRRRGRGHRGMLALRQQHGFAVTT